MATNKTRFEIEQELNKGYGRFGTFAPDGLAWVCAGAGSVHLWRDFTLEATIFAPFASDVGGIFFNTSRNKAFIGGYEVDFTTEQADTLAGLRPVLQPSNSSAEFVIKRAARSPDGQTLLTFIEQHPSPGFSDSSLEESPQRLLLADGMTGRPRQVLWHGQDLTDGWALALSERYIAAGDLNIRIWERSSLRPLTTLADAISGCRQLAFNPAGDWLAAVYANGQIRLWTTKDWKLEVELQAHEAEVLCLAWLPESNLLVTGDDEGLLKLWQLEDCALTLSQEFDLKERVEGVFCSQDGEQLIAATRLNEERLTVFRKTE